MKKDRNTFFSNYNVQSQSYIPNIPNIQNQLPNNQFGPYQQSSMSSNYYSGPDISMFNDIDNRLSKIERQINRLDNRLSKLESNNQESNKETNYTNNMYML